MNQASTPSTTTLHPPWIGITRLAWITLSFTAIALTIYGYSISLGTPLPRCTTGETVCAPWTLSQEDLEAAQQAGIPLQLVSAAYLSGALIPKVAFCLVGLFIFWRRSQDWVAQLFSLMLTLFTLEGITNLGPLQPLADSLYAISNLIFGTLLLVFPNGRITPPWIVWPAVPMVILSTTAIFLPQLGVPVKQETYAFLILLSLVAWFILTAYSSIYRYRLVSTPTERQQTKWALAGILGSFSLVIPFTIISIYFPPAQPSMGRISFFMLVFYPIYIVSYLFVSGGIAFAILRYRLWDIDFIIRRTLQYTLLTGLLAAVYFGGVVVLQIILNPLTGLDNSPVVTVLVTLVIATLFNPLRRRVQDFIDRRFYRKKYNAERALMTFAATARHEMDMDLLTHALLRVVDETIQPESSRLWLKKTGKDAPL